MVNTLPDLKQLLDRLRQEHNTAWLYGVMERHQEAILIVDQNWRLHFANPAARRLLEFHPEFSEGIRLLVIRPNTPSKKQNVCYPIQWDPCIEFQFSENEWAGEPAILIRLFPLNSGEQETKGDAQSQYFSNSWQCWIDHAQNIQFVSPNVLQLTGYSAQDFQTIPNLLFSMVHPDDRGIFRRHQEDRSERQESTSLEIRLINRNGEKRWFRHLSQQAHDEEGRWIGRYESYQDITEFKAAFDGSDRVQAILEMVGFAGQQLLTTTWRTLIPDLLSRLGETAQVDRVSILANVHHEGSVVLRRHYGWHAADLAPEFTTPPFKTGPLENSGLSIWVEPLSNNQPMQSHIRNLSPHQRAILAARNILSTLAVPVFAGPDWWGFIQFDTIRAEKNWSKNEISAIQAFANVLGTTIQRERTEDDIRTLVGTERKRTELALVLREVSLALNAVLDFEIVLDRLLTLLGQVIPFDFGSILTFEKGVLSPVRFLDREEDNRSIRYSSTKPLLLEVDNFFKHMAENLVPVLISDTSTVSGWVSPEGKSGGQSWIGVPIVIENKALGFFSINQREPGYFQQDHLPPLLAFAYQTARALQNARLFDEVAETLVHEQRLNEISQIISSSLDLSTVLQTILRLTAQLVAADLGSLALVTERDDYLHITHTYNTPEVNLTHDLKHGQGVSWRVVETGAPVMLSKYDSDPQALPDWKALHVQAYLGVPLVAGKEILGVLSLFKLATNRDFKERDCFLAEMVARQAGVAIKNARRFEEAQLLAARDSLTGLFNRRHFFDLATREYERARRYGRPVSAILLDLDNLKQINDNYGHNTGDSALQKVAQLCNSTLRRPDLIGRYGGDEYVMLLPETSLAKGLAVAERLRSSISQSTLIIGEEQVRLSVSVGVAAMGTETQNLEMLIDQADQAQYKAKQAGKNQVCAWGFDPSS